MSFSSMLLLLTLDYVLGVVAGRGGALSVHGATGSRLDGNEGICAVVGCRLFHVIKEYRK